MADESKTDSGTSATVSHRLPITSTSSPLAGTVDNRRFLLKDDELMENLQSLDISGASVTCTMGNRNTLSLNTGNESRSHDENSLHTFRKLTPVHHHPLMMMADSFDDEDTLKNSNATVPSFPDVVPTFAHPRVVAGASKITLGTADLVNSVNNNNNNDVKQIRAAVKPFYREPSPVS